MKKVMVALMLLLIESLLFYLYAIPTEAWAYSSVFIILIFGGWTGIDEIRKRKKCEQLKTIRKEAEVYLEMEHFGKPEDAVEREYQNLAELLGRQWENAKQEASCQISEANRYYIRWSHQIKTPIAALKLLIEEDIPGEEEPFGADRERLQQQREKRRDEELQQLFAIEQYVNMVLSYMRLGSETTDFVLRQTDLDEVIRMAVRRYARHFISKKIVLHYEETGARVLTDEKWLGFVIEQLLSNALKYTHEGSITIGMEEGRLTITDTGIGIRAEDLPRVCEKGYTGYNGHANQKSTGIGLYLCSTILKKLGHSFTITSQEGTGTRVMIGFPEES